MRCQRWSMSTETYALARAGRRPLDVIHYAEHDAYRRNLASLGTLCDRVRLLTPHAQICVLACSMCPTMA